MICGVKKVRNSYMTVVEGDMGEEKAQGEILNYQTLAVYLKMAEGTLRHYVMREEIPFVKIGAHVRFLKVEIDRWLLEGHRCPKGKVKGGPTKNEDRLLPFEDKEIVK
jgi:excisionase family DNA binding protein